MAVDVAVVGGGPAGAAAAFFLASRGWSVVVVEAAAFPRDKACGDGLTPRAIRVLEEMGLGEAMASWTRVDGVRLRNGPAGLEARFPADGAWRGYGLVKPRRELDRVVLERAAGAGAVVRDGWKVVEPVRVGGAVAGVVTQRGGRRERLDARWVVVAEGAAGRLARRLGGTRAPRYPLGLAVRQYCPATGGPTPWFEAYVDVRQGRDRVPGYGWVFPAGDGLVNAGVALLHTAGRWCGVNPRHLQTAFLARLHGEGVLDATAASRPRGGRLLMGGSVRPADGPGWVLVGDAAGMINPATGEGIAYAYETGRLAAAHIDAALRWGRVDAPGYTPELERAYGGYYRLGRGLVRLIGNAHATEWLLGATLRSSPRLSFALTLLANLEDPTVRNAEQYGMRALVTAAGRGGRRRGGRSGRSRSPARSRAAARAARPRVRP